ncbi:MAG: hypothetical protein KBA31_07655 [Alphaproteobacteria bacterium]|nr:hypothetical protein [Alphaproteobacteria bacterium]
MLALLAAAALANPTFDAETIPKTRAAIAAVCSASPAITVKWDAFGDDADGANAFVGSRLTFLSTAFGTVCRNPALKPEVGKLISRIVLSQAYGAPDPMIYLLKGTLHVEYLWAQGEPAPDAAFVATEIAARLRGEEMEAP